MLVIPIEYRGKTAARVFVEPRDDFFEIHQEVYIWNKTVYEECLLLHEQLKEFAKKCSKKYIGTVVYNDGDKKLQKYIKMFNWDGPYLVNNLYLFFGVEV